jgi:hypothetical protein
MRSVIANEVKQSINLQEIASSASLLRNDETTFRSRLNFIFHSGIHIQDGTKGGENFDLTITTLDKAAIDEVVTFEVVTFEGTIILNKDFGYGYSYEVIMEDAKLVK